MATLIEPLDCECEEEEFEPRPYKDLPPEIQEKAVRNWQNNHSWPEDSCDCDLLTECLDEVLSYEFGIDVQHRTHTSNGKTYSEPELYWDYCGNSASFKANLDIDKLIAHGVPGCEYFSEKAAEFRQLWQMKDLLDAIRGGEYDPEWIVKMEANHGEVECNWHNCDLTIEQQEVYGNLANQMDETLRAIYEDACRRLVMIVDAEYDYRNGDECIAEELDANDYLFDEDGEIA